MLGFSTVVGSLILRLCCLGIMAWMMIVELIFLSICTN